ncbi:MAG: hypothetical protein IPM53_29140 [Anaerolineaceae bacterium]|nr:hypothetical protein [Anaerolineaceae bacterium]
MSQITQRPERRANSLFGPIVLIAIGLFFLFNQFNLLTDLYWLDVLRLWPLLLIFLGLNVLVLQAPRPYASLFSGFISLAAVVMFGYVLLNGLAGTPFSSRLEMGEWQTEPIHFGVEDVNTAVYNITIGPPGADLYALEDSRDLIAGTITYQDEYLFDTHLSGSEATIRLAPQNRSEEWVFLPDYWREFGETNRWQLGLNQNVPADMTLEAVAGRSQLDLRDLQLDSLQLTTNAGDVELLLPGGSYDAHLVTNAGTTEVALPENGRHDLNLEVNAGSVTLHLPSGMALHVEVDRALGSFSASNAGLRQVDGQENVWETPGYDAAQDRLNLTIHISLGSVTVD